MTKDKKRITTHLTMGSFNYLLYNLTSNASNELIHFRKHFDRVFGYLGVSQNSEEYKAYLRKIDELYKKIEEAIPKRNNASHGEEKISLEDCETDKRVVLSDISDIRSESLGIIQFFLSIFRN